MKLQKAVFDDLPDLVHMNIGLRLDENMDDSLGEREVKERMFSFLAGNEYKVFLIQEDQVLLGYCVLNILLRPMYLRQLYIKEKYRNQGIGKQAIEALLEIMDIKELDIEVMYWNDKAIKFYETYGFKKRYLGMRYKKP
jgi:ribosomal protein S18 acetylase RimI-like enzyme